MRHLHLYILPLTFLLLSCSANTRSNRALARMEGEWNIALSERWVINPDGTTEKFENIEDAGEIIIRPDPLLDLGGTKEISTFYTNVNGAVLDLTTLMFLDRLSKRVVWKNVLCSEIFECDLFFQLETDNRDKQVWTTYFKLVDSSNPLSRNAIYDATIANSHTKWTLTLERE
ncbi:MAG: hypothetical protein AAFP89_12155 [Bacteroidota bacterium]